MSPTRSLTLLGLFLAAACTQTSPATDGAGPEGTAVGTTGGAAAAEADVASEVRAASVALVEAMNAHEPDSVLAFYSLGDGFTYVGCTNFMFDGRTFATIIRGYHLANPDVRYDMSVQALRVLGADMAVVALQGTSSPDVPLFTTRVLRRGEDGRWRVAWEHESWPGCASPSAPHPGTVPGDSVGVGTGTAP